MAITDRGSGAIVPTASMGATLTGVLIVTGAKHRARAASDYGGLTLIASAKELEKLCSHRPVTAGFLTKSAATDAQDFQTKV